MKKEQYFKGGEKIKIGGNVISIIKNILTNKLIGIKNGATCDNFVVDLNKDLVSLKENITSKYLLDFSKEKISDYKKATKTDILEDKVKTLSSKANIDYYDIKELQKKVKEQNEEIDDLKSTQQHMREYSVNNSVRLDSNDDHMEKIMFILNRITGNNKFKKIVDEYWEMQLEDYKNHKLL